MLVCQLVYPWVGPKFAFCLVLLRDWLRQPAQVNCVVYMALFIGIMIENLNFYWLFIQHHVCVALGLLVPAVLTVFQIFPYQVYYYSIRVPIYYKKAKKIWKKSQSLLISCSTFLHHLASSGAHCTYGNYFFFTKCEL